MGGISIRLYKIRGLSLDIWHRMGTPTGCIPPTLFLITHIRWPNYFEAVTICAFRIQCPRYGLHLFIFNCPSLRLFRHAGWKRFWNSWQYEDWSEIDVGEFDSPHHVDDIPIHLSKSVICRFLTLCSRPIVVGTNGIADTIVISNAIKLSISNWY